MAGLLDTLVTLILIDGTRETLTVGELHARVAAAFDSLANGSESTPRGTECLLNDVVQAHATPETWALFLACLGDTLHRQ